MAFTTSADHDRFDEAASYFSKLVVLTREEALSLDGDARNRAFWIGNGLQLTQIQRVFDSLKKAQDDGEPFEEWRKKVAGELTDDVHAWKLGYIVVSEHGHASVTDQSGDFSIERLPPGTYGLEAWHSVYGTKKATVVVKENEGARVDFSYDGTEALSKENPNANAEMKSFR